MIYLVETLIETHLRALAPAREKAAPAQSRYAYIYIYIYT